MQTGPPYRNPMVVVLAACVLLACTACQEPSTRTPPTASPEHASTDASTPPSPRGSSRAPTETLSRHPGKALGIYDNAARRGQRLDVDATLDAVEAIGADTYFYLVARHGMETEYDPANDRWLQIEPLAAACTRRGIDLWVTFHNPISYRQGARGSLGKTMRFRHWMVSLARLSRRYPVLRGVVVDDFGEKRFWTEGQWTDADGRRLYSPAYMTDLKRDFREQNPNFRFGAIIYSPYMLISAIRERWLDIRQYVDDVVYAGYWSRGHSPLITDDTERIAASYRSQKARIQRYMTPRQRLWYCPYITGHSWQGPSTLAAVREQLRLALEDPDIAGIYGFTLIRGPAHLKFQAVRNLYTDARENTSRADFGR